MERSSSSSVTNADDEQNTPRQMRMLINTGGAEPSSGITSGIHWHNEY
jgi:hypothetical protein